MYLCVGEIISLFSLIFFITKDLMVHRVDDRYHFIKGVLMLTMILKTGSGHVLWFLY